MLPPALAVAQEQGSTGRDLVTAVVAGFEVMYRIGRATKHSNERHGFHAPGTTGPFGRGIVGTSCIIHGHDYDGHQSSRPARDQLAYLTPG